MIDLTPTEEELAGQQTEASEPLSLEEAQQQRDGALATHRLATQALSDKRSIVASAAAAATACHVALDQAANRNALKKLLSPKDMDALSAEFAAAEVALSTANQEALTAEANYHAAFQAFELAERQLDLAAERSYDELRRDKRGELELECPTWDAGRCACLRHGMQAECPSWVSGCHCVDHLSADECPKWASGCCCNHAPTSEVADRPCNNHFDRHSGPGHTSAEGTPWCAQHQQACADGPHPVLTLEQFKRRFQPKDEEAGEH